jgi:hypothetical protein
MTGRQGEWPRRVGWGVPESWGLPERRGWYYPEWSELGQVQAKSWCGTDVIDGLVDAIEMHIANTWWSRQRPLVIGTCPWLTDFAVAQALSRLSCCLVIGKPERSDEDAVQHLMGRGRPVPKGQLEDLNLLAMPTEDGAQPVGIVADADYLTEEERAPHDIDLGPIRVTGWRGRDRRSMPMLHAKVMVFAYSGEFPDAGPLGDDWFGVIPTSVWWGSANLTYGSRKHLEFATWSNDPLLTRSAWRFVTDVIAMSETLTDATSDVPTPQLVEATDPYAGWEPDEDALLAIREAYADDEDEATK